MPPLTTLSNLGTLGSCAVITGAASGIGRSIAHALARRGINLVVADLDADRLDLVAAELGRAAPSLRILAVPTDVADAAQINALCERAFATLGRVDWLYNCAGILVSGASWEIDEATWKHVLDVNLWSAIRTTHAFVPRMISQGSGHIVNVASLAGLLVGPWVSAYTVSKHGMVALSETLHREFIELGLPLRMTIVCPGPVRTAIFDGLEQQASEMHVAQTNQYLRLLGDNGMSPDQLAELVLAGVDAGKLWVFPHEEILKGALRERMTTLLAV
ncbi:SDR family NAD(P)-dependent oxidoreductase [Herbaspirillum sp. GCM10030257]|uniref:SDR family NAD(P)-dependent oxidoreductase n=1 Tax=Herbaspirillum sp. GCM10030257 TaxID=3273393 RepID=UPI00362190A7